MSGRRRPFRYRWWSVTNTSAKWWGLVRKCAALRLATASPAKAYHLRPLPQLPRGRTHLCRNTIGVGVNRQGCFAEYLVIPAFNAFKIPDNISDDLASIFDPFGNAVHTALSFDLVGEDVLVSGAGPIGVMAAAVAKHVGARNVVITDVNEYRLELARKMGVTRAVNVAKENLNDVMAELA
ncbi:L-threonine 3-dehydrogenase [Klebsiella variicola]|uniref:L-threonine 3-dehydrogenase n=1 Tax=Klebsiella variicola TaxID=244366 RepID=A0A7H4M9P1_KLEVA|nr:L-threonine 3-dehydrogenase [Klebsiella variicola]